MSVIAIDIGNTRIGVGLFTAGKSADPALRFNHSDLQSEMLAYLEKLSTGATDGGSPTTVPRSVMAYAAVCPATANHGQFVIISL